LKHNSYTYFSDEKVSKQKQEREARAKEREEKNKKKEEAMAESLIDDKDINFWAAECKRLVDENTRLVAERDATDWREGFETGTRRPETGGDGEGLDTHTTAEADRVANLFEKLVTGLASKATPVGVTPSTYKKWRISDRTPVYNGDPSEDIYAWFYTLEHNFKMGNVSPDMQVTVVGSFVRKAALHAFKRILAENETI
jgi:hypothetical protein